MVTCTKCKKDCGSPEQNPIYVFKGEDICGSCIKAIAPYWKREVDSQCEEARQHSKRVRSGTYMKPKEDILKYGKKD